MTILDLRGLLTHIKIGAIIILTAYLVGFAYGHYGHDLLFGARAPIETAAR